MADGDSASVPNNEVEDLTIKCKPNLKRSLDAADMDINSASLIEKADMLELEPEHASAMADEHVPREIETTAMATADTSTNDMTKTYKDITNVKIQSILNGTADTENQEYQDLKLPTVTVNTDAASVDLSSLNQLCAYDSDSNDGAPPPQAVEFENKYRTSERVMTDDSEDSDGDYIDDSSSTTSSSSSSSSSSTAVASSDGDSDSDSDVQTLGKPDVIRNVVPKTKGELALTDLPPIEDLHISVLEEECTELGHIESIVDTLVVVQAKRNTPPLDLDSVLFLDHGKRPLGRVFDVFGPVTEPCYCVRFNSLAHIREKEVERNMIVYCAPHSVHSAYVFLPDLLKMKGSDASWEHNNEPPPRFVEYSDDEEERRARKPDRNPNREPKEVDPDQPSRKKRNDYEQRMNSRNLRMSAINPPSLACGGSGSGPVGGPWGGPWGPQRGEAFCSTPPPSIPHGMSPSVLIRPPSFSVPPPLFATAFSRATSPPMFSVPPERNSVPSYSVFREPFDGMIPRFDPMRPPPPPPMFTAQLPVNFSPGLMHQVPPPPRHQMAFMSSPPPPPPPPAPPAPPSHW